MRPYLQLFGPEALKTLPKLPYMAVMDHLNEQFGGFQRCTHHEMILAPPVGAIVEIAEPLQTCHRSSGHGLVGDCIPPGLYQVRTPIEGGHTSHWLHLFDPHGPEDAKPIAFTCLGYYADDKRTLIDWRGARRPAATPAR